MCDFNIYILCLVSIEQKKLNENTTFLKMLCQNGSSSGME